MKNKMLPTTELLGCNEVEINYKRPVISKMTTITQAKEADSLIRKYYKNSLDVKEHFWLISLTTGNHVLGISTISIGTVMGTLVNVKEIMQIALLTHSTGIILVHNHPSGKTEFSESDIKLTKKIANCCSLFNLTLLDHLVITSETFISMSNTRTAPFT